MRMNQRNYMKKDMIHMKPLKNIMKIGIMNNKIPHFLNWIWGIFYFYLIRIQILLNRIFYMNHIIKDQNHNNLCINILYYYLFPLQNKGIFLQAVPIQKFYHLVLLIFLYLWYNNNLYLQVNFNIKFHSQLFYPNIA